MCSTNSLRKSSYQRLQSAAFTSSSDFSGIGGFSLSNIFKSSPRPVKQPGSVSERYYFPSPPKPKPDDTFIPYINERDRMNRLISHSNREPKRARKGAELLSSLTPGKTMEGFTNAYYTPKEKKQHLTCLLSMDPNFFNDSSNDAAAEDSEFVQDAEDSLSQRPLSRFKLNIPKGRQICMLKSVSAKRNIKKSKSGHNTPRDDVAFLTIKREEPLHLRTQSNFDYPSVGHYDTKNADVLKPRIKATVISKLQLDRHKAAPQARESVSTPHRETRKLVTDFSKQTGRGNLWVKEEKKEIMKRRDVKTEMDSPVPFANNKSSSSKTKLPMGVVVNTQLPYELKLVKEVTSNVMKLYNISNDKTESHFISSREKKMKRLDQRTIEHAWIQHFS